MDLFEQLMQRDWFILLIVLIIPLIIGVVGTFIYWRRRKRSTREPGALVLLPSRLTRIGYALGILALASGGVMWMMASRYFEGAGALIGALEMSRWWLRLERLRSEVR